MPLTADDPDIVARFWSRLDKTGDCWLWTGSRLPKGYGRIGIFKQLFYTHRLAYQLTYGAIPPGADVMHMCDNPPCCNPAHLAAGSHSDNMVDAINKGRWIPNDNHQVRGIEHPAAKLTDNAVRDIRDRVALGETQAALAREYGISKVLAGLIVRRKNWAHVA